MHTVRVGISGWRYVPWRHSFYPKGLPQRRELEFASHTLPTLEINGTFYGSQKPASFRNWYAQTPEGFVFTVKGNQYITHRRRLLDVKESLARFFASGVLELGDKLGPILWQFPPSFQYDPERMADFFALLPLTSGQALSLLPEAARKESPVTPDDPHRLRYAVEIRHESFRDPSWVELLREFGIALVVADTAGKWPLIEDVTADFMYLRLHGDAELYKSGYTPEAIEDWARRIRAWAGGTEVTDARRIASQPGPKAASREVFCYFDNTDKNFAPFDAQSLIRALGEHAVQPAGWDNAEGFELRKG